jgi:hypothetical protein
MLVPRRHLFKGYLGRRGVTFEKAVLELLRDTKTITPDIGGTATTTECGAAAVKHFKSLLSKRF